MGIHPVMPDPAPTAAILSKLVRTLKYKVRLFKKYHAVDRACKKVISKLILEKFYKSLSICIIGFVKVTILKIISHLITKYAEVEEEEVQDTKRKMNEPISSKKLFEELVKKIECNQEAITVQNPYSLAQIVPMVYASIEKCGIYQDGYQ